MAGLVTLSLGWFIVVGAFDLRHLEVRDYTIRRCELVASSGGPVLRVLDAIYMEDLELLNAWCQAPEIARHFGALELRSVHRDNLDLRVLYESRYDLLLAKPELINSLGLAAKEGIDYELIAQYPDYGSQLVSLQGVPQLSAAWMKGKTLGLLDDPNSVSSYQIPRAALHRSGLADVPKVLYFRSYRELYKALFERKVDVIPALLSSEGSDSALQLPPGLVLEETLRGPAWYLRRELIQGQVYCDVQAMLVASAQHAKVDYFRDLHVVRPCNAQ